MPDGVIGPKTFDALKSIIGCLDHSGPAADAKKVTGGQAFGENEANTIRYKVRGSLPDVSGGNAQTILEEAWMAWSRVCDLQTKRARSESQAEVVIFTGQLDGERGAGTMGVAHAGAAHAKEPVRHPSQRNCSKSSPNLRRNSPV